MYKITQIFLFFFICNALTINAQELPPVQNFQAKDYNAQNQNWAITQAEDKSIFIANNSGVLEFNGANWKLYNSPNETIIRSINAIGNKIYTGFYMDFGFWKRDAFGELNYTSLSKKLNIKLIDDEQFWNIIEIEDFILFQSLNRIYLYNTTTQNVSFITSETSIVKMYKTNKGVYFQKSDLGLFKIENGKGKLVINNQLLNNARIVNVFNFDNKLLIATQNKGFFLLEGANLKRWNADLNTLFPNLSIYNCIQLKNKSFALGTISNGIIHLDKNGGFVYKINKKNGLNDNTVLSLYEDKTHNIWLGLDNGVSLINQNSPFKIYNDFEGALGSVYTSIIFKDKLYLGTNQGLFFKVFNSDKKLKLVSGTKGQVWSLKKFNNQLFCGHDFGTFIINDGKSKKIADMPGTWDLKTLNNSETKLLQGNYNGLYVLEKKNNNWSIRNKVKGLDISSRYFEIFNNNVFVNHEYKGVFKLTVNNNFDSIINTEKLPVKKGLNSSIIKYENDLYYSFKEGILKYNFSNNKFVKDALFSNMYKDGYVSGKLISLPKSNELWGFSKESLHKIVPSKLSEDLKFSKIALPNSLRKGIVGYENILRVKEHKYLLSSASGYIKIDLDKLNQKDFKVVINSVVKANYHNHTPENLIEIAKNSTLKHTENSLSFSFSVPNFDKYLKTSYQYKLDGIYDSWSDWSEKPNEFFEHLPSGEYKFLLKAKIGNKISKNTAVFQFTIAKPWYKSNTMIFVYILSFILLSLLMHNLYKRYYEKQQQELIEQNKKKIALTKAQNESEIVKIKNEKLREDFKSKSKELATSIMSVVKKNELLAKIKEQLLQLNNQDKIKPVIGVIDKSLKQNDDWNFFQEAFNNADSEFLKNLKTTHPKLSPNDLKLCAYLRLNLSSKEIAPLFNISVRSLEIKRYRLRKKMNLPHEKNLVDYILNL